MSALPGISGQPGFYAEAASSGSGITKIAEGGFEIAVGTGSETKTLPGTPLENDIVIVMIVSDATLEGAEERGGLKTSGYTKLWGPAVNNPGLELSYKRMGSTPDTSVQIYREDSDSRKQAVIIQVYRGVNTTTAIDNSFSDTGNSSGLPDPPSHTTITNDCLRIVVGNLDDDDVAASKVAPSGWSGLFANDTGQSSSTSGATVMTAYKEGGALGADNPSAFTGGSGSDNWRAAHFALRPI